MILLRILGEILHKLTNIEKKINYNPEDRDFEDIILERIYLDMEHNTTVRELEQKIETLEHENEFLKGYIAGDMIDQATNLVTDDIISELELQ